MKREGWLILGAVALILFGRNLLYGFIIKPGVSGRLQPVMDTALDAVRRVWASHGLGYATITSIQDGQHMEGSKHALGLAFDIRLNDIPATLHAVLAQEVQLLSGDAFDVVHENHGKVDDHLHVEFDPK